MTTALYLAHLNPVTNAHMEIIRELERRADRVKVMPVVFRDRDIELNSRSFPFSYVVRRRMLLESLGSGIDVTDDYVFVAPFKRYLLSAKAWSLRSSILHDVRGEYFSYTGDGAEGLMLRLFRLNPEVGKRRPLAASSVKSRLYGAASGGPDDWERDVPPEVVSIIREEWETVSRFARMPDQTVRILGMKFPRAGWRMGASA